jgi:thiamine-phosphate diphosphorylase
MNEGRPQRFLETLRETRVYAVTDDGLDMGHTLDTIDALLRAGIRIFQLRHKLGSDAARVTAAEAMVARVRGAGGFVIVNDRADIALAADADGAHLGQDDLPLGIGRALLGPDRVLGASASYLHELPSAMQAGIDYLGFGAVYPTDTKPDAEFAGLELLADACRLSRVPVVGIGGIDGKRAPNVMAQGVAAVAVVSALFRAPDPEAAARALLQAVRPVPEGNRVP